MSDDDDDDLPKAEDFFLGEDPKKGRGDRGPRPAAPQPLPKPQRASRDDADAPSGGLTLALPDLRSIPFWPAAIGVTVLTICLVYWQVHRNRSAPEDPNRTAPRAIISLDSPVVTMLGALEGPYLCQKAASPNSVILVAPKGGFLTVRIHGWRDQDYPETDPALAQKAAADPVAQQSRQVAAAFQTSALNALLTGRKLWLIRLTQDASPSVYLFEPQLLPATGAPPKGKATLVNALGLRQGIALMETSGNTHPFYDLMLENQEAAIVAARRAKAQGGAAQDIWNKFQFHVPPEITEPMLAAMNRRL